MRLVRRAFATGVMFLGVVVAPAATSADASSDSPSRGVDLPAQLLDALERDLDLTASEVQTRLANEAEAPGTADRLEAALGSSFAGAWLAGDVGTLTVAVTDAADAAEVRAAGATPTVVDHSEAELDAVHEALDRHEAAAPAAVAGWFVNVRANELVVVTSPDGTSAAREFMRAAGVDTAAVRIATSEQRPRLFDDVIGGDAYYTPGFRCSIGFSVQGGYTTAGHCGTAGTPTSGFNQAEQGTFSASSFPGDDHAWVAVNSNWVPQPIVNGYGQGNVTVTGSTVADIGASVCRSGSTTGWHCGVVQAYDQTVQYAEGTVFGLTRTDVCAEGGDSGGSFISGSEAQGMTSGGSGNCTVGGTTFFQPVNETLSTYGLTLVTG